MSRRTALAVLVALLLWSPAARAQIQKRGPELWPGKNEISLHIGGQGSLTSYSPSGTFAGGASSGFRFGFDYGRLLQDYRSWSLWLDLGFNFIVGTCDVAFFNAGFGANFHCDGDEFRPFAGVKFKFRTPIPLVPYAKVGAGAGIFFNRYCDDNGFGFLPHFGGGVKYFLTRHIGLGIENGFTLGVARYSGAPPTTCGISYFYPEHTELYAAYDIEAGAEFIF